MKPQTNKISPEQREQALLAAGIAGRDDAVCELKLNGQAISTETRDELLKKCANNEYVELELNVIAYEQHADQMNRNYVRVAENAMPQLAKSSIGKPFLFDHDQSNSHAVCGTIIDARHEVMSDGTHRIMQTVKLTAPKAVDLALRGLMKTVSISWRATKSVDCSACSAPVFTDCYHWPGDKVKKMTDHQGKVIFVRNRKEGDITVQWVYNGVEALETSPTPVPAVPTARIDGIRASLSAGSADVDDETLPAIEIKTENKTMDLETLKAQLERATKMADLSDAEKAYFRRLGAAEQDAFLGRSAADRAELLKPIYTAKNGTVFTAADDPRMVQMAKNMDTQQEQFDAALATEKAKNLVARASVELAHLSGTIEQRAALLGAIESIADVDTRTAVLASIKDVDTKQARNFVRQGAGAAKNPKGGDPEAQLERMAQELSDKTEGMTLEQAYDQVLTSDAGQKLYAEIENAKRN